MSDLLNKKCVPCEGGVIPFDISEIHKYQKKVDGWNISKDTKNIYFLKKKFNFKNFLDNEEYENHISYIESENELLSFNDRTCEVRNWLNYIKN